MDSCEYSKAAFRMTKSLKHFIINEQEASALSNTDMNYFHLLLILFQTYLGWITFFPFNYLYLFALDL